LRFHSLAQNFSEEQVWQQANIMCHADWQRQTAIVATITGENGTEQIIGVAHFVRADDHNSEAESAIVIRDDFQRRGLGKHLLRALGGSPSTRNYPSDGVGDAREYLFAEVA